MRFDRDDPVGQLRGEPSQIEPNLKCAEKMALESDRLGRHGELVGPEIEAHRFELILERNQVLVDVDRPAKYSSPRNSPASARARLVELAEK